MKSLLLLPLLLVLVVPVAYGEEFNIEFPDHAVFIKGELVTVHAWGVEFDSKGQATGIVLDNTGNQIDSVEFEISRFNDVGDQGWVVIETNNSNYQVGVLYTITATYQGQESQLQFTLSAPPPTTEELATMIQSQQQEVSTELETLRNENVELRQQITNLNERIDDLLTQITNLNAIVREQINVMMTYFQ